MNIPAAALEKGCSAYTAVIYRGNGTQAEFREAIRAAFLAIVEGWPGMLTDTLVLEQDNWGGTLQSETALILPLPPPPAGETNE